ncbi:MAG: IspD/TarI family cytidylyltransferase [Ignavibacteriaceae bacterium]
MKVFAIIPAGGKGTRSGSTLPKQYVKIKGKELIVYTLETFQKNKLVDEIIIPADPSYFDLLLKLKKKYKLTKVTRIVEGGKERQDSVYNGLTSLTDSPALLTLTRNLNRINPGTIKKEQFFAAKTDLIIVHDAARPLLPQEVLSNAIKTAKKKGNALVCIKAKDTLIKGSRTVNSYLDRNEILYVQTPQIFKFSDLMNAMKKAYDDNFTGTDESMLVKRLGKKVNIVEGSVFNFKVTTKDDLELVKRLL